MTVPALRMAGYEGRFFEIARSLLVFLTAKGEAAFFAFRIEDPWADFAVQDGCGVQPRFPPLPTREYDHA